ncbi:putative zinc finger protein [Orchesella cincta]|uniref:Putative zinc finger protein n=1 Tax=Orchesella cincta TaxID=48709 RepID=A0A1D2M1Y3_ORCCI|nr:putative zinc finger protein [Orchesella cincta]
MTLTVDSTTISGNVKRKKKSNASRPIQPTTKKFSSWSDCNNHFNQAHDSLWPCEICKRVFKAKDKLAKHEQIHSELKQFVCVICEHRYRTLPNLMSHISSLHTQEKPFPCTECPAEFALSSSLRSHIIRAHRKGEWVNKCFVCDKKFSTQQVLYRHLQTHTGERPYICSHSGCNKNFPTQGELRRHLSFHIGDKKYTGSVCGKKFVTNGTRNQHVKTHNKNSPQHSTSKNTRKAIQIYFEMGQLNKHVRQFHKNIRQFPCSMCDKSFYRAYLRDNHLSATHLNEKCEICDKRNRSSHQVTQPANRLKMCIMPQNVFE